MPPSSFPMLYQQVNGFLYERFQNDPAIKGLFPNEIVRVYPNMAPLQVEFPYIVTLLEILEHGPEDAVVRGTFDISCYSSGPTSLKSERIAEAFHRLFDHQVFREAVADPDDENNPDKDAFFSLQLYPTFSRPVGTENPNVHRHDIGWQLHIGRLQD